MCLAISNNLLLVLKDAPKRFFFLFSTNSSCQPKNDAKTPFPTLHPLSPVIFATATVVAFVLLRSSRFDFHCYTQREATPTNKSARKWRCDLSRLRLLARKITKGIHSYKPALLNCSIDSSCQTFQGWFPSLFCFWLLCMDLPFPVWQKPSLDFFKSKNQYISFSKTTVLPCFPFRSAIFLRLKSCLSCA